MRIKRHPGKFILPILLVVCLVSLVLSSAAQADASETWLYLRAGKPLTADEAVVEVVAVGDIMLGRTVKANQKTLERVSPWLAASDLSMGNFEGVLAPPGKDPLALSQNIPGKPFHLVMGRQVPALLKEAGFDLLSLGNNHALDLKTAGLVDTLAALDEANMEVIGISPAPGADQSASIQEIKGVKIAFLGFSVIPTPHRPNAGPVPTRYDSDKAAAAVRAVRQQADVVIVNMHWGIEYQTDPYPAQEQAAQTLYEAGADLIIGHHPHVVQGTAVLTSRDPAVLETGRAPGFVAYSLGNFVFDQFAGETLHGLALRILIDKTGLRGVEALPLRAATRPRILSASESINLLERIQPDYPTSISFSCGLTTCQPGQAQGIPIDGGLFTSGQIDLTGDGKLETIQLEEGEITIVEDGKTLWRSPSEWEVIDLALGDPNDDGRAELLISLLKADAQGIQRSHPFIVGYRGGTYKLLWGGSALSTPISEVELGDVDGDGVQELVVLEAQAGSSRSVSVLNWHGWGFILQYRSESDFYHNLALSQDEASPKKNIEVERFLPGQGWESNHSGFR